MQKFMESVKDMLRAKALRVTPQRKAILQILVENQDKHLSAEDIYAITREEQPEMGLATVYRTLDLFVELGIVDKLEFGEKSARYELNYNREGHYHHHLICLECGKIIEFNEDLLEDLEQRISQESGFIITDHALRFYGYCAQCRGEQE